MSRLLTLAALLCYALTAQGATVADQAPFARTEQREPCRNYDPLRRPLFGDTHVHTAWSFDAAGEGTRNTPADAYRFARGETVGIQPYAPDGRGLRRIRIDRPLDFAAVTDHSELLGEITVCNDPQDSGYNHPACLAHRYMPALTQLVFGGYVLNMKRRWGFCGEDGAHCAARLADTWELMGLAAEEAYDRSADCNFTSFVGYEWTATVGRGTNLHHNVIFRNARVPAKPASWVDTASQLDLWDYLEQDCVAALPGCDAVVIPHNANLSRGLMFESPALASAEPPAAPVTVAQARRRAHWNPLFEVMQHKGASECDSRLPTWGEDEFCDFELLPYDSFGTKNTGEDGTGMLRGLKMLFGGEEFRDIHPPGESAYLRHALKKGLQQQRELGANSFKFGLIGSTDTHIAAPGLVMEKNHPGHNGGPVNPRDGTPTGMPDELEFNPGGLAVLYAEENSRDAIFAAMRRREAYATSGTRPVLRFFGGWEYSADLCERDDMVARGYAGGVPMGGDLPPPPASAAGPRFLLSALADPGTEAYPGSALERIQVVKGWYEGDLLRERVFNVAGGSGDAAVDTATCEQAGDGHRSLCAVWRDPDFAPGAQAFYYARVLEVPGCRWNQQFCVDAGVRCEEPATIPEGLEACCDDSYKRTVQERAWSSPIWYTPATERR